MKNVYDIINALLYCQKCIINNNRTLCNNAFKTDFDAELCNGCQIKWR